MCVASPAYKARTTHGVCVVTTVAALNGDENKTKCCCSLSWEALSKQGRGAEKADCMVWDTPENVGTKPPSLNFSSVPTPCLWMLPNTQQGNLNFVGIFCLLCVIFETLLRPHLTLKSGLKMCVCMEGATTGTPGRCFTCMFSCLRKAAPKMIITFELSN